MTRTIITANGTRLREEGVGVRTARRAIFTTLIILAALFISAAIIGFVKASTNSPADNSVSSFNDGWDTGLSDILEIAHQKGGMAKVNSCLHSSHNADEFHTCIDG
jgi:hypothetical protein